MMNTVALAILAAVPQEIESLADNFPINGELTIARNRFTIREHSGIYLILGTTGIGKTNAAAVTAAVLTRFGPVEVWLTGCSGAYEESGLTIGDVLVTREWVCGDEGVLEQGARISSGHIGLPLLTVDGYSCFDRFSAGIFAEGRIAPHLANPGRYILDSDHRIKPSHTERGQENSFSVVHGTSITVGMVSGDPQTAHERYTWSSALAENMEGSAVAQTCLLFGAPFMECRGISNIAGVREKSEWRMSEAMANCHAVIRHLIESARWTIRQ